MNQEYNRAQQRDKDTGLKPERSGTAKLFFNGPIWQLTNQATGPNEPPTGPQPLGNPYC